MGRGGMGEDNERRSDEATKRRSDEGEERRGNRHQALGEESPPATQR
jgi:hypothetical protein